MYNLVPPGFCTTPRLKKTNSTKHLTSVEGSMPKLGHILRELYDTEIDYVNTLDTTVNVYFVALENDKVADPKLIFGNIKDVLLFHKYTFLPRLEEVYHSAEEVSTVRFDIKIVYIKQALCSQLNSLHRVCIKLIMNTIISIDLNNILYLGRSIVKPKLQGIHATIC